MKKHLTVADLKEVLLDFDDNMYISVYDLSSKIRHQISFDDIDNNVVGFFEININNEDD